MSTTEDTALPTPAAAPRAALRGAAPGRRAESKRGVKGGYSFARRPPDVTVLELVELLDGPFGVGAESVFGEASASARAILHSKTMADVVEREDRAAGAHAYYM